VHIIFGNLTVRKQTDSCNRLINHSCDSVETLYAHSIGQ